MPWIKHSLGLHYQDPSIEYSEGYARNILRIFHQGGILHEMPSPMDKISPSAVLRFVQIIVAQIFLPANFRDIYCIDPSCFSPNAHLPNELRCAGGGESCPYEDDRSGCQVCICQPSDRIHRLHDPGRTTLWNQSDPAPQPKHYRVRIESPGKEPLGIQGDFPNPGKSACGEGHHEGGADFTG